MRAYDCFASLERIVTENFCGAANKVRTPKLSQSDTLTHWPIIGQKQKLKNKIDFFVTFLLLFCGNIKQESFDEQKLGILLHKFRKALD